MTNIPNLFQTTQNSIQLSTSDRYPAYTCRSNTVRSKPPEQLRFILHHVKTTKIGIHQFIQFDYDSVLNFSFSTIR